MYIEANCCCFASQPRKYTQTAAHLLNKETQWPIQEPEFAQGVSNGKGTLVMTRDSKIQNREFAEGASLLRRARFANLCRVRQGVS